MAYDPAAGAALSGQLAVIEDSIARLEAAASDAGATSEEIIAAHSNASAAAADFDPAAYVARTELIKALIDENVQLQGEERILGNIEVGMHVYLVVAEVAGGVAAAGAACGPVVVVIGVAGAVRGLDHAITGLLKSVDGVDRKTFLNQAIVGVTGSETAGTVGETAVDVGLLLFNIKQLLKPGCFVAGTQVVTDRVDREPDTAHAAIAGNDATDDHESSDQLFAAGAFALMAGLSVHNRRTRSKRNARRLRLA